MTIEEKARALFLGANESDCPDRDEAICLRVTKCLCGSSIAAIATALREARNAALEEAAVLVEEGQDKAYGAINEVLRVNAFAIRALREGGQ